MNKYKVIYNGKVIKEIELSNKDLANYKKALKKGLPKAKLELIKKPKIEEEHYITEEEKNELLQELETFK